MSPKNRLAILMLFLLLGGAAFAITVGTELKGERWWLGLAGVLFALALWALVETVLL
jgi:hypothetical protein